MRVENKNMSKQEAKQKAIKALDKVLINEPEEVIKKYPHQLSGFALPGMSFSQASLVIFVSS